MRTAFVEELTKIAEKDKNVWLLTGDLGFSVFDDFQKKLFQTVENHWAFLILHLLAAYFYGRGD